ncbi:hypothetical protein ACT7DJ_10410 [Bacillus cereus]
MWQAVKDFFTTVTNPIEAFSRWIVELSIQLLNFFLGSIVSVTKIDTEYQKGTGDTRCIFLGSFSRLCLSRSHCPSSII